LGLLNGSPVHTTTEKESQVSYNGSGTFSINTAGQPVITGTVISSTAFNALTADLATGLSTAITKDGQTTTTARVPFAQGINSTLTTDATSATTGSIITAGGISMQKALFVGTTATVTGATTMAGITATSLALGGATLGTNALAVTGTTQLNSALNYGGVTLSNSVTGTGSMVLSASPVLTGLLKINNGSGNSPGGSLWIEDNNGITYSPTVENTPTSTIKNETGGANRVVTFRLSARDSGGGLSNWNISSVASGSNLGSLTFQNGANERGRWGSDGSFLVGTTTNGGWGTDAKIEAQASTGCGVSGYATGAGGASLRSRGDTDTTDLIAFYRSTVKSGSFISSGGGTPNIQWLANNQAYVISGGSGGVTLASAATAWAAISDETLKTNLAPIQSGAEKVASLRAVTGRYKTDAESMSRSFLIAQDVQKVLPEAVSTDADGTLSLRYTEVIPLMVAAIQELTTRLAALESK
jgi:hypothetical protein